MKPKSVTDVELAFPAHVVGKYLPDWSAIPDEFRTGSSPWCRIAHEAFLGRFSAVITLKDGIDVKLAGRHLRACLGSYEPKHEHKIAGVAYLMSLWFQLADDKETR